MISLSDYTAHDGLGLAELVARKQVKPEELTATALAAIEKVNPKVNAVLQTLPTQAETEIQSGLPQGPFTGVPFLIKELVLHAKGVRCDMGSKFTQGYAPSADTELMARFRRAGLVLLGTTQTPELGYNPTTETVLFGPVQSVGPHTQCWRFQRWGWSCGRCWHRSSGACKRRRRLNSYPGLVRWSRWSQTIA